MRRRRAVTLLVLTLFAPGSAQYLAGNRAIGRIALRVWVAILGALALTGLIALLRRSWVLGLFSQSWFLFLLTFFLAAGAVVWAVLFLDALRLARLRLVPQRPRSVLAGVTALLVLATSGTMAWGAANAWSARSAVMEVFGGNSAREASDGRYNILLLGGDSGASRVGTRPDTIMLASVDADSGKTVMFGFSRDTENINFPEGSTMKRLMPEGWNCGDQCLLNGLYTWAMDNKSKFPADVKDPGALATKEAVEGLTGLDVQYYALVDLKGFQRLVNALGGLDINVQRRTAIGGIGSKVTGYIEPGLQHLDGYRALWYARSRVGSTNYERMARQRCVINAMVHQLNPQTVLLKFRDLAAVSGSVLQTDLPESGLGDFADLALKARGYRVKSLNFVPPLIKPWDYDPNVIKETVRTTIEASEKDDTKASNVPVPTATVTNKVSAPGSGKSTTSSAPPSELTASSDDLAQVCSAA